MGRRAGAVDMLFGFLAVLSTCARPGPHRTWRSTINSRTATAAAPGGWRWWRVATALIARVALALPAAAMQLAPANLTRLIGQSDVIVSGQVKSVTDGIDAKGVPYTAITLLVGSSARRRRRNSPRARSSSSGSSTC